MEMTPVTSSNIVAVGYDSELKVLAVDFGEKGGVYKYMDFPQEKFEAFMNSESIGKYFYAEIRGKYETVKVPTAPPEAAS